MRMAFPFVVSAMRSVFLLCPRHARSAVKLKHISLKKVGEYIIFPAKTVHQGFISAVDKIIVTAQLFCGYSNSAELPRVKHSVTDTIGTQTGTLTMSSHLSNSVIMNWDTDYPYNKFNPTPRDTSLSQ